MVVCGSFSKINQMWETENPNKFRKIEVTPRILSDNNRTNLKSIEKILQNVDKLNEIKQHTV